MTPPVIPARDAALMLRDAGRILIAGVAGEPGAVLDAVRADPGIWAGITLTGAFIPGVNDGDLTLCTAGGTVETIFATEGLRRGQDAGRSVAHLPLHYSALWARLARPGVVGAAVLTVPPPRADGTVSYGIACDFVPAAVLAGTRIVAVVNPRMPDPPGSPRLPLSRIAALVEDDRPLPELPPAPADAVNRAIADHVLTLLRPGDTLQLGLGRLQTAVLERLRAAPVPDLAYHGGMITAGVDAALFARGITTGTALGDAEFYGRVGSTPGLRFAPVGHTHALTTLSGLPGLLSVGSALSVDLSGQVNAEYLGRQVSGQGGMVDFIRGARASVGGRSVIALPSASRTGSRILTALPQGTPVSLARGDVDIVVTEHGIADLREADLATRTLRLAAIAAPPFRDDLAAGREVPG